MQLEDIIVRPIRPNDNAEMAKIIRASLVEFNAAKPGTVYYDPTTDTLFELFRDTPNCFYSVAEINGNIVGGAGIYPTEGLPAHTCELVKMYLKPEVRGIGLGKKMIEQCITIAQSMGYTQIYLETMPELKKAVTVYEKLGFVYLNGPLGNSGHHGCDIWMLKQI